MFRDILLTLIDPDPEQPRKYFGADLLAELGGSMAANGLAVPILVRPVGERFVIVHGERRYKAALSLGWAAIAAEVRDVTPDQARWLSLVENVQRADLSPIEEAQAYQERLAGGLTQAELGERIGKSQSYIAHKLRLLGLPEPVQAAIGAGAIAEGHARQLLRLKDTERQGELCERATTEAWTVARTRLEVDAALAPDMSRDISPLSADERQELERCEGVIGDYLASMRTAEKPPNERNPLEVAIWAEQRMDYLRAAPMSSLLERQNDYATVNLYAQRAAGHVLNAMERGDASYMDFLGLDALGELLQPKHEPRFISTIAKRLWKRCPGIELADHGMGLFFPESTTLDQWLGVGRVLEDWAGASGDPEGARELGRLLQGMERAQASA